jgi:hypothetical protein
MSRIEDISSTSVTSLAMPRAKHHSAGRRLRALAGTVAVAALIACGLNGAALAEDAKIKSMSFETLTPYKKNTIQVTSSTGAKWDTILPGQVEFWADMRVDTKWPGYVQDAGIFLGACANTQCGEGSPLVFFASVNSRDYNTAKYVSFSTSKLQISSIIPAVVPYGDEVLKQCNKKLQPDGATKPHDFDMPITLAFTVNTRTGSGDLPPAEVVDEQNSTWGGGDETRHGEFLAHVECRATSRQTANPNPDPHRNKISVTDLDLFLATIAGPGSSSRGPGGSQCKPVQVTTRIATDKEGPVTVKQWRQVNGGAISSEMRQMDASALGGGKFGDDWVKVEHFAKTTTVQYKDEVIGGTFAPSTPWKSITVHCNGDYASPQTDANPDNRRREPEKARERDVYPGFVGPAVSRPRPLADPLVLQPVGGRRPMIGNSRPLGGVYRGPGFAGRGPMFR